MVDYSAKHSVQNVLQFRGIDSKDEIKTDNEGDSNISIKSRTKLQTEEKQKHCLSIDKKVYEL